MEGWISLHRKFLSWEWFDKPEMVQLFIWLLLNANYADTKWQGKVIKRGQMLTTTPKIMEALRLTEQQTRTCIGRLKSTGEITCKSTNKYTIITICNYDRYQDDNFPSNGQNNGQNNIPATDKQRTNNGLYNDTLNVSKQINNNNNNNNNNISLCNDILDAHTREDKEREEIFKIFFFKNFVDPLAEVERFYTHFGAQGWVRGNGQRIKNKIAVARSWEQQNKDKQRFPQQFIEALREAATRIPIDAKLIGGIEKVVFEAEDVWVYGSEYTCRAIEGSQIKDYIKAKSKRRLHYAVKRAN